ncbi:MAG: TolC family protein [Alphaproteobacteria bacterium]|nr:TolC family protein [Alphaproteobacteria bacterium]
MKKTLIWQLALVTLLFVSPAFAEQTSLTLDQVIKESLQKNTSLFRAQRDYDDKLATATETTLLDNPELQVDVVRDKGQGGTGTDLEFTQPLKFSQISGSRAGYANALSNIASMEQKYEVLKVINETTVLYTQAWLLSERKKLYESYADDADKMKKLVKESAGQGQTSPAASHLFSSDASKLRVDANAVDAELRQVRTDLARLTGRSYQHVRLERPSFIAVPTDTERLLAFAQTQSNVRNLIKNRIQTAEQRLSVARQDAAMPEFGPRVFYSRSPNGDDQSYGIGVALRIPLWNQNDAERKRANAELRQAKSEADLYSGLPQQDVIAELQQSASALQERADSYFDNILPGYRKSYEMTRSMFRQGQADALEVWQVREKLLSSENEALDALAQAVNARGTLELELGGKLEEVK